MRNDLRDRVALRTDGGLQTGRDLLVAPVTRAGATHWPVYLPTGVAFHFVLTDPPYLVNSQGRWDGNREVIAGDDKKPTPPDGPAEHLKQLHKQNEEIEATDLNASGRP
jgi:hypothetical protein